MSAESDVESICDTLADRPSFSVTHGKRKFLICGCSHGGLALDLALDAIVKFKEDFRPDFTCHLGDWTDTTAWRAGAKGTSDEGADVAADMERGLGFLSRLRPQAVFIGNHEHRIYRHADHPNAIVREAARSTISSIREFMELDLGGARLVETYDWDTAWLRMGNYLIGHGISFSENAVRDHAERVGNCIIAHLHRQEVNRGRRSDSPTCVSVGYLGDRPKFKYADLHPSRYRWQVGWCYGEFTDNHVEWQLHKIHTSGNERIQYDSV